MTANRTYAAPRGYLTFAQQTEGRDYLRLAYALALSIRATQKGPEAERVSVIVTPGTEVPDRYARAFDQVIDVPWLDEARDSAWKLENEWKAFHATPYEQTIKLDADMLFVEDISWWWDCLARQDVILCHRAKDIHGRPVPPLAQNPYRACFAANDLPDAYTAFMFFKQSDTAQRLFEAAEMVFHDWERFFEEFLEPNTRPREVSTDVVFAVAMRVAGITEECMAPEMPIPAFVHLKTRLQGWPDRVGENWTKSVRGVLSPADLSLRVANVRQVWPVHYHDKEFLTDDIIRSYEKKLGW